MKMMASSSKFEVLSDVRGRPYLVPLSRIINVARDATEAQPNVAMTESHEHVKEFFTAASVPSLGGPGGEDGDSSFTLLRIGCT